MRARQQSILIVLTLATVLSVLAYLSIAPTVMFDAGPITTERTGHDEQAPLLRLGSAEEFKVGFAVNRGTPSGQSNYVVADIIVDEDFIESNGHLWKDHITEMLQGTNQLLSEVDIEIRIGNIDTWHSERRSGLLRDLLESAESQYGRDPSRLLIVLTCEDPPLQDGLAQSGRGRLIVEYYHNNVPRNSALLSHEVGHLFGAGHHEDTEECHGEGCIMDERGYRHMTDWCDHHIELIRNNVETAIANTVPGETVKESMTGALLMAGA